MWCSEIFYSFLIINLYSAPHNMWGVVTSSCGWFWSIWMLSCSLSGLKNTLSQKYNFLFLILIIFFLKFTRQFYNFNVFKHFLFFSFLFSFFFLVEKGQYIKLNEIEISQLHMLATLCWRICLSRQMTLFHWWPVPHQHYYGFLDKYLS